MKALDRIVGTLDLWIVTSSVTFSKSVNQSSIKPCLIPDLFHIFSDFVVYVVTTLIFRKNQRQCTSFSINVTILFLSFKRATTVPKQLIYSQHHKRLRRKSLTAFHSLSHLTLTTTQLNLSFFKTSNSPKRFTDCYYLFATPTNFI